MLAVGTINSFVYILLLQKALFYRKICEKIKIRNQHLQKNLKTRNVPNVVGLHPEGNPYTRVTAIQPCASCTSCFGPICSQGLITPIHRSRNKLNLYIFRHRHRFMSLPVGAHPLHTHTPPPSP